MMKRKLLSLAGGFLVTVLTSTVSGLSHSPAVSRILLWHAWLFSSFVYLILTGEAELAYRPNPIGQRIFLVGVLLGIPIYSFIIYLSLPRKPPRLK
jgi:hypothetical protein